MLSKQKKSEIVAKLKDKLGSSNFVAFLNFHGLSVAKAMELRRVLKKVGAEYVVAKKTLLGIAAKGDGLELGREKLEGEIGVVVVGSGEDTMLAAAKEISSFAKKNKGILKIIGGFRQKSWIDAMEIKRLAAIPSREILLTQLAFILSQPMASLARALNEVIKKVEIK